MKTILMTLLCFVGTLALASEPAKRSKATKVKVMAYNVHHCNPPSEKNGLIDVKAIAAVITAEKPDLVALQEIDVNTTRSGKGLDQAQELGKLTGMYAYFSKSIDLQGGGYGVAILSKYPIVEQISHPLPVDVVPGGEPRSIGLVKVKINKKKTMWFGSTHLDLKKANREDQAKRINQLTASFQEPVVIAGDFNDTVDSEMMQILFEKFDNSCTNCQPTFPEINPKTTIDFILMRKKDNIKANYTRVIDEQYASDHLPVVSELLIK